MTLPLQAAWEARLKRRDEADAIWTSALDIRKRSTSQRAEVAMEWARAERIWAESEIDWISAVVAAYGNCVISWSWQSKHGDCTLENGDTYMS